MPANTDATPGLTTDEAKARLAQFGPNEPTTTRRHALGADVWHAFANPLVLILVIAAVASAFLGDVVDAGLISIIVLISAAIDVAQTHRSQAAVERLRDRVAPTAAVRRDGEWRDIHRRDLVPGDVVRLSAGDLIPGDARLPTARDPYVQQAALPRESPPAEKEAAPPPAPPKPAPP